MRVRQWMVTVRVLQQQRQPATLLLNAHCKSLLYCMVEVEWHISNQLLVAKQARRVACGGDNNRGRMVNGQHCCSCVLSITPALAPSQPCTCSPALSNQPKS